MKKTKTDNLAKIPRQLLGMTIRELITRYQGIDSVERYIKVLQDLTDLDEKYLLIQERRLKLASLRVNHIADRPEAPLSVP
jgi:acetone carboxylase gamma subunit